MFDITKAKIWSYKGIATQPVGVPNPMGFRIQFRKGQIVVPIFYRIQPTTAGGARALLGYLVDSAGNTIFTFISDSPPTTANLYGPELKVINDTITAQTPQTVGIPPNFMITGTDEIRITGAALANTEYITIYLRCLIFDHLQNLPIVSAVGAGVVLSAEVSRYE